MKISSQPFFSIVIPTLNEAKYLPHLLSDLSQQTFLSKFEVIVVDGCSDDSTIIKAQDFLNQLKLRIFKVKTKNVAFQRNYGSKKARGEWIIFMDADDRLPRYFLDGIKYQLAKNPKTDIFTTWIAADGKSAADTAIARSVNLALTLYQNINKPLTPGALIGAKKEVIKKVGFDPKQKVSEDSFFTQSAIKKGFHFQLFPAPTYIFSYRRLRKEGTLKMIASLSMMNLKFLQGKSFEDNHYGYVMEGGAYYEKHQHLSLNLTKFLKTATAKQITLAKKILTSINQEIGL